MKKDWYKSKKLVTTALTLLFVILTDTLGIPVDTETYWAVVGIVSSYILGQSAVDASKEKASAQVEAKVIEVEAKAVETDKFLP